jgi:hypothetical protein
MTLPQQRKGLAALFLFGDRVHEFFVIGLFFNGDVGELSGVKDFAAGLALYEFGVFVSGDDLYDGVFASSCHGW